MYRKALVCLVLATSIPSAATAQDTPAARITSPGDARTHGLESLRVATEALGGVPLPEDLYRFVRNREAALVLGKAAFWDTAFGSDGVQACASCHFHAGADSRSRNQLNPGTARVQDRRNGKVEGYHNPPVAPDTNFEIGGPDSTLEADDFPFVRNPNELEKRRRVIGPARGNSNDVASSQGVFLTEFRGVNDTAVDDGTPLDDPIWNVRGTNVRRVEPRNTPSVVNSVFNFVQFWDGRANHRFNGQNPFGANDRDARIYVKKGGKLKTTKLDLNKASLASQAVGPVLSAFEMSFDGRTWPEVGRKMLGRRALSLQAIAGDDSVFGNSPYATFHGSGKGLEETYEELVEEAFDSKYWSHGDTVRISGDRYSQMEANFAMFFGFAVML